MKKTLTYKITELLTMPLLRILYRPVIEGEENLPNEPSIIAANQTSELDGFALGYAFGKDRPVAFVAREHSDLLRRPINWYHRRLGNIIISRKDFREASRRISEDGEKILNGGKHLAIFPEGCQVREERLGRFHTGVARLSIRTGRSIVPVYMNNYRISLFGRGLIRIGPPIEPTQNYKGNRAKQLTERVKQSIQDLSDYPDPTVKDESSAFIKLD